MMLWKLNPTLSLDSARAAAVEALLAFDADLDSGLDQLELSTMLQRICVLSRLASLAARV